MGFFDDAVRDALATVDSITSTGGIQVTVTHRPFVQQDAFGDADPYGTPAAVECILKEIKQAYHSSDGRDVQNQSRLFVPRNLTISTSDEITLPDGTKPPILEIGGLRDATGGRFYTVVTLGQSARAARGTL